MVTASGALGRSVSGRCGGGRGRPRRAETTRVLANAAATRADSSDTRRSTQRLYWPPLCGSGPRPAHALDSPAVPEAPPPLPQIADVQRSVTAELDRIAPVIDELGRRFADAGHELALVGGPVRDAMLGRSSQRPGLHHLGPSGRDRAAAQGLGRRDLGHGPRVRHDRLPQGRLAGRDHDVPLGVLRPVVAQARRRLRRQPGRRPRPARLHGQRDGGAGARPRDRGPVRRRGRSRPRRAAHPGPARGLLLRRPAADDARRAVRRPARLHRRPGGRRRDAGDGRSDRDHLRRAGARRAGQAGVCAVPPPRADPARRDRAGRHRAARAPRAGARARRAPPAQGRLPAHADRAGAGDRPREPPARGRTRLRVPVRRARCTTWASRGPGASSTTAPSPSTTTTWSAPS